MWRRRQSQLEGQNRTQTARASTASRPGEEREGGRGERARLESIAAAGPSMVSNVRGGESGEEEVNELYSLILNVTLKRELCSPVALSEARSTKENNEEGKLSRMQRVS